MGWQTLEVRASGPRDVRFEEVHSKSTSSGGGSQIRGQFRSMFSKAGSYVVWVTVGGQAVVGWPRVIHVSPNVTDADQSKMRPEAETLALMSELVTSNQRGNRMLLGAPVRSRRVWATNGRRAGQNGRRRRRRRPTQKGNG